MRFLKKFSDGLDDVQQEDRDEAELGRDDQRIRNQRVRVFVVFRRAEEEQQVAGTGGTTRKPTSARPVSAMSNFVPTELLNACRARIHFSNRQLYLTPGIDSRNPFPESSLVDSRAA